MSVDCTRQAAAQRTAATKHYRGHGRRWAKLASWLFIVPMLAFFSFSVVANARTVGKPDYEAAIKKLPPGGTVVVVKGGGKPMVCSVNDGQAAALAARWKTGWTSMEVNGRSVPALWVDGPNEHELRSFLGAADCRLVRQKSIFYLPFNANLS
jgi:hypothetical protein